MAKAPIATSRTLPRVSVPVTPTYSLPIPSPKAWVAHSWLSADGSAARDRAGLAVFAVSVHEAFPSNPAARLTLLRHVVGEHACTLPEGAPSLWVFPAGFFGFDAQQFAAASERAKAWDHPIDIDDIERVVSKEVMPAYPEHATLVFGADMGEPQFACVLQQGIRGDGVHTLRVQRHQARLPQRRFQAGPVSVSVFVCGEFCGSRTESNGAYYQPDGLFLDDPCEKLADCGLLIDLAHSRVPGTVRAPKAPPRYSHQRQLENFSAHGAGLLTHHHAGLLAAEQPSSKHQSGWLIFRNGQWLDEGAITPLR